MIILCIEQWSVYFFAVPSTPPFNVTVVDTTSELVTLTWYPPLREHRNGIITGYLINLTAELSGNTLEFSSNTTNITVDDLMPYTTYLFIVAAETIVGSGPFSLIVSVRTEETGMINFHCYASVHHTYNTHRHTQAHTQHT